MSEMSPLIGATNPTTMKLPNKNNGYRYTYAPKNISKQKSSPPWWKLRKSKKAEM